MKLDDYQFLIQTADIPNGGQWLQIKEKPLLFERGTDINAFYQRSRISSIVVNQIKNFIFELQSIGDYQIKGIDFSIKHNINESRKKSFCTSFLTFNETNMAEIMFSTEDFNSLTLNEIMEDNYQKNKELIDNSSPRFYETIIRNRLFHEDYKTILKKPKLKQDDYQWIIENQGTIKTTLDRKLYCYNKHNTLLSKKHFNQPWNIKELICPQVNCNAKIKSDLIKTEISDYGNLNNELKGTLFSSNKLGHIVTYVANLIFDSELKKSPDYSDLVVFPKSIYLTRNGIDYRLSIDEINQWQYKLFLSRDQNCLLEYKLEKKKGES